LFGGQLTLSEFLERFIALLALGISLFTEDFECRVDSSLVLLAEAEHITKSLAWVDILNESQGVLALGAVPVALLLVPDSAVTVTTTVIALLHPASVNTTLAAVLIVALHLALLLKVESLDTPLAVVGLPLSLPVDQEILLAAKLISALVVAVGGQTHFASLAVLYLALLITALGNHTGVLLGLPLFFGGFVSLASLGTFNSETAVLLSAGKSLDIFHWEGHRIIFLLLISPLVSASRSLKLLIAGTLGITLSFSISGSSNSVTRGYFAILDVSLPILSRPRF
jgi:hypothetical protein